jgi:glycosyltransferase involved in cell wall biosynthesis
MERRSVHPDVTIVIPARNEAKTIGQALASVAEQAWPLERLEVVVVDNGSTDGTPAAVREFQRTFPWLRVRLLSEPQPGVSRARNRGAEAAHGHVLLFLDADSRLAPTMIPAVLGHLHRGEAAVSLRVVADSNDPIDRVSSSWQPGQKSDCACRRSCALSAGTCSGQWVASTSGCASPRITISYGGSERPAGESAS